MLASVNRYSQRLLGRQDFASMRGREFEKSYVSVNGQRKVDTFKHTDSAMFFFSKAFAILKIKGWNSAPPHSTNLAAWSRKRRGLRPTLFWSMKSIRTLAPIVCPAFTPELAPQRRLYDDACAERMTGRVLRAVKKAEELRIAAAYSTNKQREEFH